jgi:formate hydrogenlyase subunit 3/multisubunit Na+/H+ antiporter MnhD subunit
MKALHALKGFFVFLLTALGIIGFPPLMLWASWNVAVVGLFRAQRMTLAQSFWLCVFVLLCTGVLGIVARALRRADRAERAPWYMRSR